MTSIMSTVHLAATAMCMHPNAGIVGMAGRVPEQSWSKSQLKLLSLSPLTNLFYERNGLFNRMGVEWCICMSSPAKMVFTANFKFAIKREKG